MMSYLSSEPAEVGGLAWNLSYQKHFELTDEYVVHPNPAYL